jgi:hypothetical protein
LGDILEKIAPKSFGQYFSTPKKYRPNGEISPNLVTLRKPHVAAGPLKSPSCEGRFIVELLSPV